MFEVSESTLKPVNQTPTALGGQEWPAIVRETLARALATGLISPDDEIVSFYHRRLEFGYPTPSLSRGAAISKALPWLRERSIWSRVRFGSWKYEVGNQDHSLMLGVEAVDNIMFGTPELTLRHPNIVNEKKNEELRFERKKKKESDERCAHEGRTTAVDSIGATGVKIAGQDDKINAADLHAYAACGSHFDGAHNRTAASLSCDCSARKLRKGPEEQIVIFFNVKTTPARQNQALQSEPVAATRSLTLE